MVKGNAIARVVVATGLLLTLCLPAQAQERVARSFEQLQVFVGSGDTVLLRSNGGEERRARITTLSATQLIVTIAGQTQVFLPDHALRIRQRRNDSLANGSLIGLAAGAGIATVGFLVTWGEFPEDAGLLALVAGLYGGIGAGMGVGVDALIRGRQVIYERVPVSPSPVSIAPLVGAGRAGARLTVRF